MFCVGDIVVYGAQGLCKVDGIGPLPMKFADKSKRYYTLHTCKQPSMTIYAPVDNQTRCDASAAEQGAGGDFDFGNAPICSCPHHGCQRAGKPLPRGPANL